MDADVYRNRGVRGWQLSLAAIVSALATASVSWPATSAAPSGCTSIADQPPIYSGIQYGAAIQGIFDNFLTNGGMAGCADCHVAPNQMPAGNLSLGDGYSYGQLIGQPSSENPNLTYVVPNHPEQSLLFQKINCDFPPVGSRMPLTNGPLGPDQQALIYDWIAEGAPVGTTDGIFRGTFDLRGFDQ